MFSSSLESKENTIIAAPGCGQEKVKIRKIDITKISINNNYFLKTSHPAKAEEGKITFEIPANEEDWSVLADQDVKITGNEIVNSSLQKTRK